MTALSVGQAKRELRRIDDELRERIVTCTDEDTTTRNNARRIKHRELQLKCARLLGEVERAEGAANVASLGGDIAALDKQVGDAFDR